MSNYRKHYNPIYGLWELQREKPSGFRLDSTIWETVLCRDTEAEIDAEMAQIQVKG